jgi:signal transduction histidine kinase
MAQRLSQPVDGDAPPRRPSPRAVASPPEAAPAAPAAGLADPARGTAAAPATAAPAALADAPPAPDGLLAPRGGYLHIGPDWRITFAHLQGGRATDTTGQQLEGKVLWEVYPEILGTPFEEAYRATMRDRQPRTFEATYGAARLRLENRLFPAGDGIALYYEDVSRRVQTERQLARRNHQQEAVARLGLAALEGADVPGLQEQAVREVAQALDVPFAKLVEPTPDGDHLRLVAGVGWRPGVVGEARLSAATGSQAAFAIAAHGPVLVRDLRQETRFAPPELFLEHGIVSGLSVLVGPRDAPLGVLGAHSDHPRDYSADDLNFMQAVANLLAAAIARSRIEGELRRHRDDLEGLVRERTRLLEATNHELEAFAYSVSHDLRTPLRAIDGFSHLLVRQHGAALPPSAQELLQRVQENAQRMGHLIESLLALSRLGRRQLAPGRVDVSALAREVLGELAQAEPGRRVAATVEPGLSATADPDLMRVLLENLLGNAWKFTAQRSKARIEVAADPAAAGTFVVRDNGAGFDMDHAGSLFQPFQRLHSGEEFEGTGVGLATVQRIVQRHGGRVWAEAEPGKGAAFFVWLPQPGEPRPAPG